MPKFNRQHKQIYQYLTEHGPATYRELNDKLFMRKSDMRVSEMNNQYKELTGNDLIVTVRKLKNGEHVKGLVNYLTKRVQKVEIVDGVAKVRYEEAVL